MHKLNDYELIYLIRQQDENAFIFMRQRYELLIFKIAHELMKQYPNVHCPFDDLCQEGNIALISSINNFRDDKSNKFVTFAYIVIQRQMKNYLKANSRHYTNEFYFADLSVQEAVSGYAEYGNSDNPSTIFFSKFEQLQLKQAYNELPPMEKRILKYKLNGKSYNEIALLCNINRKKVDNTLQKIKCLLAKSVS